jgi:hypothetical protein
VVAVALAGIPGYWGSCELEAAAGVTAVGEAEAGAAESLVVAGTTQSAVPTIFAWQPIMASSEFKMAKVCVGV